MRVFRSEGFPVQGLGAALLCMLACGPSPGLAGQEPRPAAAAGAFYPEDPTRLRAAVQAFLDAAVPARPERPLVLVVPHAGYIYSGQIAADAFRQAAGHSYDVVVILGVNHKASGFGGISVYDGPGLRSPLGVAACDRTLAEALRQADPRFAFNARADAKEHSVEVQVPFIQTVLPGVPILDVVVGGNDPELWKSFGVALARTLAGRRPLIVASSDLSHYPSHADACASDRAVLEAVAALDPDLVLATIAGIMRKGAPELATCACGEGAIIAALTAARQLGALGAAVLSYANSGDTALGDRARCVGYGAVVLTGDGPPRDTAALVPVSPAGPEVPLSAADRRRLLQLARETIEQYLDSGTTPLARGLPPVLCRNQGAFVTLKKAGRLRGCIGHLAEDTPLGQVVGAMAMQAAFNDRRFDPLQKEELDGLEIEISVLTPFRPVSGPEAVVPGRDGVVLRKSGKSAVYLPQVATEQGWDRDQLLTQLSLKAGLPADAWRRGAQLSVFQAEVFGEHGFPDR